MGTQVDYVFGGELFRGPIVDVDEDEANGTLLYHIEYEDEDQTRGPQFKRSCRRNQTIHRQIENGEIDEWAIGDE